VPNAPSWTGIRVTVDGEELDLATCEVKSFRRELDMSTGSADTHFYRRHAIRKGWLR